MSFIQVKIDVESIKNTNSKLKNLLLENFFTENETADLTQLPDSLRIILNSTACFLFEYNNLCKQFDATDSKPKSAIEENLCRTYMKKHADKTEKAISEVFKVPFPFKNNDWYKEKVIPLLNTLHVAAKTFEQYAAPVIVDRPSRSPSPYSKKW